MFGRVLLPAMFIGSLVSILMQLTCMWPVVTLSRELNLSAHRVLYASAASLLLSNALALPLMARRAVQQRPRLTACLAGCLATVSLAAGSAVLLLLVTCCTRAFFQARLAGLSSRELEALAGRYLGNGVVNCARWPACPDELAGHMCVLLLSAAFYNSLACLLSVASGCFIVRGVFLVNWPTPPEEDEEAADAEDAATTVTAETAGAESPTVMAGVGRGDTGARGGAGANNLPISPVWIVLQ